MATNAQLGIKTESTYATAATPVTNFVEFDEISMAAEIEVDRAVGYRASGYLPALNSGCRTIGGYSGSAGMRAWSVGFGTWLRHAFGAVATTGAGPYVHTFTLGDLCGVSFTMQDNVPFGPCGATNNPNTYAGCKIASWELSQEAGGSVMFAPEIVAASGTDATALATASYAAAAKPFCWGSTTVTVGGTTIPVKSWKVSVDQKLDVDRHLIRGSAARLEPVRTDLIEATVEFEPEWTDATWQAAALAGTTLGPFVATATEGANSLALTVQSFQIDEATRPGLSGRETLMQTVKGTVLAPSSGDAIEAVYTTTDATV